MACIVSEIAGIPIACQRGAANALKIKALVNTGPSRAQASTHVQERNRLLIDEEEMLRGDEMFPDTKGTYAPRRCDDVAMSVLWEDGVKIAGPYRYWNIPRILRLNLHRGRS